MTLFAKCLRGRPRGLDSGSRLVFPAFSIICATAGLALVLSAGLAQAKPAPAAGKKAPTKKDDCGSKGVRKARTAGINMLPAAPGKNAPKWSCAAEELDLPPVWQGGQMTCGFSITNAGGGMLNIKASAG